MKFTKIFILNFRGVENPLLLYWFTLKKILLKFLRHYESNHKIIKSQKRLEND